MQALQPAESILPTLVEGRRFWLLILHAFSDDPLDAERHLEQCEDDQNRPLGGEAIVVKVLATQVLLLIVQGLERVSKSPVGFLLDLMVSFVASEEIHGGEVKTLLQWKGCNGRRHVQ